MAMLEHNYEIHLDFDEVEPMLEQQQDSTGKKSSDANVILPCLEPNDTKKCNDQVYQENKQ